jgi:CheY-like chemotaxis protein
MSVHGFREPVEAIEWLREGHFADLVIANFSMPSMGPMQLARALRNLVGPRELPVILLSATGRMETGNDAGAFFAHLVKPIRGSTLLDTISRAVGGAPERPTLQPHSSPLSRASSPKASALRVLVADDNDTNQKLATKMLDRLGVAADVAGNGLEVLQSLERKKYDVILMDVQMPEMDGIEATREIARRLGEERPRVIALTANAAAGDRERCLAAGMDDYLAKPFSRAQLAKALGLEDAPAAAAPQRPGTEVLDAETIAMLEKLYEDDPAALGDLMGSFVTRAQSSISSIAAAVDAMDSRQIAASAHKLKGAASAVGAQALWKLAAELETRGKANERRGNAELMKALGDCFERTCAALQGVAKTPSGSRQTTVLLPDSG